MLKWGGSTPVGRLRRLFSAGRYTPGGGVGDVRIIPPMRSTLRPPPTVKRCSVPENWCSLIGRLIAPVMVQRENMGAFTFLEVKGPPRNPSASPFEVCIFMDGELAQVALQYLQKEQYVYVSGSLHSYNKINLVRYTVNVEELNLVRTQSQNKVPCRSDDKLKNEDMTFAAPTGKEWIKERHILWQIFFANPFEWWDRRARKFSPKHPDFKHKSTSEALWIGSDDPPWVKKQLDLYDSEKSETNLFKKDAFGLQGWKMQDFDHL